MFVVKHHRFHRLERSSERSPASWIVMDLRQKKGRIAGKHGNLPVKDGDIHEFTVGITGMTNEL